MQSSSMKAVNRILREASQLSYLGFRSRRRSERLVQRREACWILFSILEFCKIELIRRLILSVSSRIEVK